MTPAHSPTDETKAAIGEYPAAPPPRRDESQPRIPAVASEFTAMLDTLAACPEEPPALAEPFVQSLGEYQILGVAGRGGMGVVYEALQVDPPRRVALKVLAPALRPEPAARRRFRTECLIAGRLHHTHIVPVLATVPGDDGPAAYAMPYIRGRSLAAVLDDMREGVGPGGDRSRAVVEWVRQAAEAVAAAHAAGVTHCDVKPGNLLIELDRGGRPHVWLHDFGLAVFDDEPVTELRAAGTPKYASPEQAAGAEGGRRPTTDVYALGVTLAEALTLIEPTTDRPVPLLTGVPRELRRVIAKATAAAPADRYPTAAGLADDLSRYLAGYPVHAGRPAACRAIALWAGRHCRPLTGAALGFLLAAAVGSAFLYRAYTAERAAREAADDARRAVATYTLAVDDTLYADLSTLDTQRKLLEQAVEVHRRQLDLTPSDLSALRHLAQSEWRLGRAYTALGRTADGVEQLRKSVAGFSRLAEAEPGRYLHRLDLARSYSVLAWAGQCLRGPAEVKVADANAYRVMQKAVADFRDVLDVRDAFASYAAEYGGELFSCGKAAEAETVLGDALAAARSCQAARPGRWQYVGAVVGTRMQLARLHAGQGRLADALTENAAALELNAQLVAKAKVSADGMGRLDLVSFRTTRAELLVDRGPWLVAAGAQLDDVIGELTTIATVIAAEHKDRVRGEAGVIAGLKAWAARRAGTPDPSACRAYEATLTGPAYLVARSRYYADGPGERNPALAVELAREAVLGNQSKPHALAALGLALYRNDQFAAAEVELARVADRPPHRSVGLVRAMIAARQGRDADAKRLFQDAVSSRVALEPCNPELEREAKALVHPVGR